MLTRGERGGCQGLRRVGVIVLRGGLVDVGDGVFDRTDAVVDDGRIATVGAGADAPGAEVVDCARFAVVPGMVNAHAHSNESWFRGMWDNLPLEPWMLFSYPVLAAPAQTPDEVYVRTLLSGIEMLRSGATCVVDFLYELQGFSDGSLEAVVRAYRDLGLRAVIGLAMADRAYYETVVLDAGLVDRELIDQIERERPPSWSEWEALTRSAIERFHRPDEGISICPAPSGPQRCTDEMLVGAADLAEEFDLVVPIHVLETRMQAVSGQQLYGRTLVEHLDSLGFLSPRTCFEHAIWLTPSDIEIVRDRGVTIVHNPVSNLKLGSGVCPVPTMLRHDVNVALGTDGVCSNDGNDMFATVKFAALLHKVWDIDYEEWLGAREAWRLATENGAAAAGDREGLGRIAAGRRADLVLLDLDSLTFTPLNDPLRQLALGSTTLAVRSSLVGGRWVLRDGTIAGVDERAILQQARELGDEIRVRYDPGFEVGRQLLAGVRAGWLKAMRADVGVERKLRVPAEAG
jgi:5-methylthioadenosine/S-adenosylhomocysteine deaminase